MARVAPFAAFLASVAAVLGIPVGLMENWDLICERFPSYAARVPYATCKASVPAPIRTAIPPVERMESTDATPESATPALDQDTSTRPVRPTRSPPSRADDEFVALPPAALPRAPKLESIRTQRHQTKPAGPCIVVGSIIEAPISVRVGSQLCAENGRSRATVHDITSHSVTYSVPGGQRVVCKKTELCSFKWDGAPLFNIDVMPSSGAGGRSAILLNAR